jgi:hypothetical protein
MNARSLRLARAAIEDEAKRLGVKVAFFMKDHHPAFKLQRAGREVCKQFGCNKQTQPDGAIVRQDVRRLYARLIAQ